MKITIIRKDSFRCLECNSKLHVLEFDLGSVKDEFLGCTKCYKVYISFGRRLKECPFATEMFKEYKFSEK